MYKARPEGQVAGGRARQVAMALPRGQPGLQGRGLPARGVGGR